MKNSVFDIANLDCPTEEGIIRKRLKLIEGIDRLDFDLLGRKLTVAHRLDDEKMLLTALRSVGMEARLRPGSNAPGETAGRAGEAGCACCAPALTTPGREEPDEPAAARVPWARMALAGATAAAAEIVAWTTGREQSWPVAALALVSIAAGGPDTFRKGWIALRTLTLNINFLMMLAVAGAVAIGSWPEAAMVTFLFAVAELIEAFSLDRARNAIRGLMALTPETATVRDAENGWREVAAAAVEVGRTVRVKPGERIPLDGQVTAGQSSVNQAPITGESIPVEKKPGDPVFAGSVNERGAFEFEVTASGGDTTLARIIRSVQAAQAQRAPTQLFVDRFARRYTPAVVVAAVLVAAVSPLVFGAAFIPWLYRALVLLVIACPCALVISTPVTVVSGLAAAARRGILIKGGVYLELGRKLRVVALDKTGTLTLGRPALTDVVALDGATKEGVLQLAASLDVHSEHPVASAIVAAWTNGAKPERGELLAVTDFESLTGRGVRGRMDGRSYFVGNHRLAEEKDACGPAVEAALQRLEAGGKTAVVLLTADGKALGVFGVADTLRETSVEAVRELHALGVQTVMLTGDNPTTAAAIARQVGIGDARGGLLPEDKLAAVGELLARHGVVGMVGDGINDAPALARASIGFAMGAAGTDTALETADVALMQDDLRRLPLFIRLSRQTARLLAQNIALAVGIKVIFFALALTGHATLWTAVFADLGASLLVVFNGLRILRFDQAR